MNQKIRIGVIPAAGAGTRLGYLSRILPKTLFPLYDRPILHHVLDHMHSLGIRDVYIIVNVYKEKIIEYCKKVKYSSMKLHFVYQRKLSGTASAILMVEKIVGTEPFLVIYGDDFTDSESIEPMLTDFMKTDSVVMEAVIHENNLNILRGTCSVGIQKTGRITEILEKPANPPYRMRGCGIYLFRTEVFDFIRNTPVHSERKEREITHTIKLIAHNGKAVGYPIRGCNININSYDDLLNASMACKKLRNKYKFKIENTRTQIS